MQQCEERAEWEKITEKAQNPQWVVTPVKEDDDIADVTWFGTLLCQQDP